MFLKLHPAAVNATCFPYLDFLAVLARQGSLKSPALMLLKGDGSAGCLGLPMASPSWETRATSVPWRPEPPQFPGDQGWEGGLELAALSVSEQEGQENWGRGAGCGSASGVCVLTSVTLSSLTVGRAENESSKPMTKRACHWLGRNFLGFGISWSVK